VLWEREKRRRLDEEDQSHPEDGMALAVGAGCAVAGEVSRVVPVDGTGKEFTSRRKCGTSD